MVDLLLIVGGIMVAPFVAAHLLVRGFVQLVSAGR